MRYLLLLIAAVTVYSCNPVDPNPVKELTGLKLIDIIAEDGDLERLFNNRHTDLSIPVRINYEGRIYNGRLRAGGGGSRYYPKFSFRIILNEHNIMGVSDFSLSAQPADPTYIKTAVASYLYSTYNFPVFYSEPVFVSVNNSNYGIYNFIERINENYFLRRNMPVAELYQVLFEARFSFLTVNNLKSGFDKEIPEDDNFASLAELITASDKSSAGDVLQVLAEYMDIDNYLLYHAISTLRNDPDSFSNNFYIYKSSYRQPFTFIPWDFDKSFTGNTGLYGYNELIESLLRNEHALALYKGKLKEITENTFKEEKLYPIIERYYSQLEPYYQLDPFLVNRNIAVDIENLKTSITQKRNEILNLLNYDQN